MNSVEALRKRVQELQRELAADPDSKIERVQGVPVRYQRRQRGIVVEEIEPRTTEQVERELAEARAELKEAQEQAARAFEQQQHREKAERDRRQRAAREQLSEAVAAGSDAERRYLEATVELDELIATSPIGRMFEALADADVAATSFHAALLPVVGNISLYDAPNEALNGLLEELGEEADAVRRSLAEGHPAKLHPNTRPPLRYAALIQRLFSIPDRRK